MRVRTLQIISALITIGIMVELHDVIGGFLQSLEPQFVIGLAVGVMGTTAVFVALLLWERRSLALREEQRARDLVDL